MRVDVGDMVTHGLLSAQFVSSWITTPKMPRGLSLGSPGLVGYTSGTSGHVASSIFVVSSCFLSFWQYLSLLTTFLAVSFFRSHGSLCLLMIGSYCAISASHGLYSGSDSPLPISLFSYLTEEMKGTTLIIF